MLPDQIEGKFQYQGQLGQYLEEQLSPRGSQTNRVFFSEEDKKESTRIEYSAPEVSIISNQSPERGPSTMVVVKQSDKVEGSGENIDAPLCRGLYKEEDNSLVPWSGTDPDARMNCFTWYKEDNDWIVPGDQYNEKLNNYRGPIHNGQFRSNTIQEKRKKKGTCSKYAGYAKFNGIPREVNPEIPVKF